MYAPQPERIYYPQQGEFINLFLVTCDGHVEEIFTHKVQAEAYIRACKENMAGRQGGPGNWNIQHKITVPLDNNC